MPIRYDRELAGSLPQSTCLWIERSPPPDAGILGRAGQELGIPKFLAGSP